MVIKVSKVKVSISLSKINCEGANYVHQTYVKFGTTQPLKGTEIESNTDDSCEPTRRHMNNWTPKYIVAAFLCSYFSDMPLVSGT
jgi:hypothetical protein